MSVSISFFDAIRSAAAAAGRAPNAQQVADLNIELQGLAVVDPENRVTFPGKAGQEVEAPAFIADAVQRFPALESTQPALLSQADREAEMGILRVGGTVMHGRPKGDAFADLARAFQAADAAKLAREAAQWPNPFRAGPNFNRTRQVVLTKTDPDKAARFRAEAGA